MADPPKTLTPEQIRRREVPKTLSPAEIGREVLAESAEGVVRRALDSFTIGYGDEIIARVHSTFADIPYEEALAQSEAKTQEFQRQAREQSMFGVDPLDVAGLATGGGALFRGAQALPLLSRLPGWSRGVGSGAIVGGAAAAGQPGTLEERVSRVPTGAAVGAAVGPVAAGATRAVGAGLGAAGEALGRFAPGAMRRRGAQDAAVALERDRITRDLGEQRLQEMGPQALLADLGVNTREAAQRSVELAGPTREAAEELLRRRGREQGGRVRAAFEEAMEEGRDFQTVKRQLDRARSRAADPLYENVRAQQIQPTDNMRDMLRRDSVRQGYKFARRFASERGIELPTYRQLVSGDADLSGLQTWDYIKRGVDQYVANLGRQAAKGKNRALYREADETRRELLGELDTLYPPYQEARAAWGGPSRSMELMDEGRKIFDGRDPEEWADFWNDLLPGERDFVRLGVVREVNKRIGGLRTNRDASALFDIPNNQEKLALLFPRGENFSTFVNRLIGEEEAALTAREVLGRSPTAGLQARGEQALVESIPSWMQLGRQLLRGDFAGAAEGQSRRMAQNLRVPPAQREATAQMLFEPDREAQLRILDRLTRTPSGPRRLVAPALQAAAGGGTAAAAGQDEETRRIADMLLGGS